LQCELEHRILSKPQNPDCLTRSNLFLQQALNSG
jgi:hypothetical protein